MSDPIGSGNFNPGELSSFYMGGFENSNSTDSKGYVNCLDGSESVLRLQPFIEALEKHGLLEEGVNRTGLVNRTVKTTYRDGSPCDCRHYMGLREPEKIGTKAKEDAQESKEKVHRRNLRSYSKRDLDRALYFLEAYALMEAMKTVITARGYQKLEIDAFQVRDEVAELGKKIRVALDLIKDIHDYREARADTNRERRRGKVRRPMKELKEHLHKLEALSTDDAGEFGMRIGKALETIKAFRDR